MKSEWHHRNKIYSRYSELNSLHSTSRIFHILKISRMTLFCNLIMERSLYRFLENIITKIKMPQLVMHKAYKRTAVSSVNETIFIKYIPKSIAKCFISQDVEKNDDIMKTWIWRMHIQLANTFSALKQVDYVNWVNTGTTETTSEVQR